MITSDTTLEIVEEIRELLEIEAAGPQGQPGLDGAAYYAGALRSDSDGGYTYLGRADAGSEESDAVWDISRFASVGGEVVVTHAADVAWADRLTATYT